MNLPIREIKIGRNTYKIYENDYIMDNGSCYQFCTNGRILKHENWNKYTALRIPKTTVKKVILPILDKLKLVKKGEIKRYYFVNMKTED